VRETYTERVLVPDPTRLKLLVVAGDRPALPSWTLEDPGFVDSIRTARSAFGITSPFLRLVRMQGEPLRDKEFDTLLEFDGASANWELPEGLGWLPFAAVADELEAGPFGADVAMWAAEVVSGDIPPMRPAWARPGWFEVTTAWLREELARHGRSVRGSFEHLGSWAISCVLAAETDQGRVVLKAVPELFRHEPALTVALATEHPGQTPVVIAALPEKRLLLMEAFGGAPLGDEDASRWGEGLVELARIQQSWIGRRAEAERIRVDDRSLAALERELESIVTDEAASPGLAGADRERLVANLPRYQELIARLAAGPVPETLMHADFHPWNVQRDGDRLVIFDWSDACWGHPFFDVGTFTGRTEDVGAREAMRKAYLAAWADYADPAELRTLLAWATPLTELHLAITWRRLKAIFESDVPFPFVDGGVQRHLEFALAATESADSA
jgi:Phosphotransferase enzyme family